MIPGFRPLSGNLIFQRKVYMKQREEEGFRPLSGNLIFQFENSKQVNIDNEVVSVPCRGILFFKRS